MSRTLCFTSVAAIAVAMSHASAARADDPPSGPPREWLEPETPADPLPDESPAPAAAAAPPPPADAPAKVAAAALLHHSPVSSAQAGQALEIEVVLDEPQLARGITFVYRAGKGPLGEVPFARAETGYRAVLHPSKVVPGLAYAIEVTGLDGTRAAVFATREAMHPIQVLPDAMDEHERELLRRLGGRRSRASVSGEYVDFGSTATDHGDESDRFWVVEGTYSYRPLRTIAEFGFRGGVVRGTSPGTFDEGTGEQPEVGLNYGASSVRFRILDAWHVELEGLASISDEGFSTGGGTKILIGDPYRSKLVLGASFVGLSEDTYFGSRFFSRVDLAASDRVTVSPTIEITDMPNADRFGVRLLAEVGIELGAGFSAHVDGGYQARRAASGGPAVGGGVTLDF